MPYRSRLVPENCDGWRTGLGDSGLSGHAAIYGNGRVQSIVSHFEALSEFRLIWVGRTRARLFPLDLARAFIGCSRILVIAWVETDTVAVFLAKAAT